MNSESNYNSVFHQFAHRTGQTNEIENGLLSLLTLLTSIADKDDTQKSLSVITTSPSLWVTRSMLTNLTVFDISPICGPTAWTSENDLRDSISNLLTYSGWPRAYIKFDHKYESENRYFIADVVLEDALQKPIAVIELKKSISRLNREAVFSQAKRISVALQAKYTFIYDGNIFINADASSNNYSQMSKFPTPQDLGITFGISKLPDENRLDANMSITQCRSIDMLIESLDELKSPAILIDYTIPWGILSSDLNLKINSFLPPKLQFTRFYEFPMAIMLLVAIQSHTKRLIAVVPRTFTDFPKFIVPRKWLYSHLGIAGIIELPRNLWAPMTNIHTSIIALGSFAIKPSNKVAFTSLPDRGSIIEPQKQLWFQDFIAGLNGAPMHIGFQSEIDEEKPWVSSLYHPDIKATEEGLHQIAEMVALGDLCDIYLGFRHAREETTSAKGAAILRGRDISLSIAGKEELTFFKIDGELNNKFIIVNGDILLQRIGEKPKCIIATKELEGAIAGDTVYILRPKDERANPVMISQFLSSKAGQDIISRRVRGGGAPTISTSDIKNIPIPILPFEISRDIDALKQIEISLRAQADKLESMRLSLFSARSKTDLDTRLSEIRQSASIIGTTIKQTDALDFQIRNLYPFPLSYAYRTLGSIISIQSLYQEQLRVAENILSFLASCTLALLCTEDRKKQELKLLDKWQKGISPGHWKEILYHGASLLKQYEDNNLAKSLVSLCAQRGKSSFEKNIISLINAKNDYKHDRGPKTEDDFRADILDVEKLLNAVMSDLAFFTEYPLRLITSMDSIRGSSRVLISTLKCVGDHPALPQENCEYYEPLKVNDIYIQIRSDNWLSLFPFITISNCPTCKMREIYFIDKWRGNNEKAFLKSYERGHPIENVEIGISLSSCLI